MSNVVMNTVLEFEQPTYGEYEFPVWALVIGWSITASSLVCIPVYAVLAVRDSPQEGTAWQKIMAATRPAYTAGRKSEANEDVKPSENFL